MFKATEVERKTREINLLIICKKVTLDAELETIISNCLSSSCCGTC